MRSLRPSRAQISTAFALLLAACGPKPTGAAGALATGHGDAPAPAATRVAACTLMPKEEVNAITGASYTTAESHDDGPSSESSCHYATAADPAGLSLGINWLSPRDYSNPAEHAALQRAAMGGAKLGGKLTAGMAGAGIPGAPNGPVEGVGDEATSSMMLLTARKGDYTVTVQIVPSDMMALMTDSTVGMATMEKEKALARKVLAKL